MRAAPPDEFAAQVRALLDEVDQVLAARPSPMPPWERIQRFIAAARGRRRRRIFTAVAAAAAAVAGLLVLQQVILGAAQDKSAPSDRRTPTFMVETRGNLADDEQWLAEFEARVATEDIFAMEVPGRPLETPATHPTVAYASDLGGHRVAVLRGTWPQRPDSRSWSGSRSGRCGGRGDGVQRWVRAGRS